MLVVSKISLALPILFHSFTGCNTTSAFFGKGKKVAWEAWNSYPEVRRAFTNMALNAYTIFDNDSQYFLLLEHFTVSIYNKTSDLEYVNEVRMELFCQRSMPMDSIPPKKDAILEQIKSVAYQAGIWTTSKLTEQNRPFPESLGWKLDESTCRTWFPVWTTLPIASTACLEVVAKAQIVVMPDVAARKKNGIVQICAAAIV